MKKILPVLLFALTVLNAPAQTCIPNTNSLQFNGSTYVSFAGQTNLNITDSITVEAWIYPTVFASIPAQGTIYCHHSWSLGEQGFVLRAGGQGQVDFNFAGVDTNGVATSWQLVETPVNAISLNQWNHVAGTYDGHVIRMYVNGLLAASAPFEGSMVASTAYPAAIGRLSDQGQPAARYWTGNLDEIRVWHRVLTGSEILATMNTHIDPATQTGLVAYYRFNEGAGSTINDLSTSGNTGTTNGNVFSTLVPFSQSAATPTLIPNGFTLTASAAVTYQWNVNGQPIPNATTQQWTALQNGSYTVTVTDSIGCQATSSAYIIAGVGIIELDDYSITVSIHDHFIQLHTDGSGSMKAIRLLNLNGALINEYNGQFTEKMIDVNGLANGIYLLQLSGIKTAVTQKIYIH